MELAKWLDGRIREMQPNRKQTDFQKWADIIRLMREVDGRTHEAIRALYTLVRADAFWAMVILSPDKLREKYDDLELKLQLNGGNRNGKHRQAVGAGQVYDPAASTGDPNHGKW